MTNEEIIKRAYELRGAIEGLAAGMDDGAAVETPELFPLWDVGIAYAAGVRVRYGADLYKVVQAHTSQADWTPDKVPALFVKVAAPGEIPDWVQPTGAQDAYNKGDKVKHKGSVWVSTVDGNIWEPGVYGWEAA